MEYFVLHHEMLAVDVRMYHLATQFDGAVPPLTSTDIQ